MEHIRQFIQYHHRECYHRDLLDTRPSHPPHRFVSSSCGSIPPLTSIHALTATAAICVAFIMSLIPRVSIMLLGALTSWLAAFLTLIAFFCDIALFAYFSAFTTDLCCDPDV